VLHAIKIALNLAVKNRAHISAKKIKNNAKPTAISPVVRKRYLNKLHMIFNKRAPHSWGFLFYPFNVDMDYPKLIPLGKLKRVLFVG
jgi:hypothetical protein